MERGVGENCQVGGDQGRILEWCMVHGRDWSECLKADIVKSDVRADRYKKALEDAMDEAVIVGCSDAHFPEEPCNGCKLRKIIADGLKS